MENRWTNDIRMDSKKTREGRLCLSWGSYILQEITDLMESDWDNRDLWRRRRMTTNI